MGKDPSTLAVAYSSTSYDTALLWTGAMGRYQAIHQSPLYYDDHMWAATDSVQVSVNNGAGAFILFGDGGISGGLRDELSFKGPFCQLTNAAPGTYFEIGLAQFGWDSRALSLMLVHTQKRTELRQSIRDSFLNAWNQVLADRLPDQAEQDGDPVFGWDAFPTWDTEGYLSPNKIYVTIFQKLIVDVPNWPWDYKAHFTYWIQLHRKSDGRLQGFVRRIWVWVEGGAWSEVVYAIVDPNVRLGAIALNQRLQMALDLIGPVNDVYLLPGRQLTPVNKGVDDVFIWNHLDDVTMVIEP